MQAARMEGRTGELERAAAAVNRNALRPSEEMRVSGLNITSGFQLACAMPGIPKRAKCGLPHWPVQVLHGMRLA